MKTKHVTRADELLADADRWGPAGDLGNAAEHADAAADGERAAVDAALGLQMISIRLQRQLLADLKQIAEHHGIGYQPMIRDLLSRFAASEIRTILRSRLETLERDEAADGQAQTTPVNEFLRRKRA